MKKRGSLLEILHTSLKLGVTSFGGPVAHLGYFKDEYVDRRKWLDDKMYADIIALCQFLPGPASSQVGMAIGMIRGGFFGGIVSWFGFTIPSVIALVLFALAYQSFALDNVTWILSLKIVAVAVVAHAIVGLGGKLIKDKMGLSIALFATLIMLLYASAIVQICMIAFAGFLGYFVFTNNVEDEEASLSLTISKKQGVFSLLLLVVLLLGLPILAKMISSTYVQLFDIFFRVGSIVFGGGHVVLPLLEQEMIPLGLATTNEFLAGYGAAQAVPGPLFTFASYLGTISGGILGAFLATIAIFLPSFLLVTGALPFLNELRKSTRFRGVLSGVNASVVGILLAALYDPVFTSSIQNSADFGLAVILFGLLHYWKTPAWLVVIIGVILGELIFLLNIT